MPFQQDSSNQTAVQSLQQVAQEDCGFYAEHYSTTSRLYQIGLVGCQKPSTEQLMCSPGLVIWLLFCNQLHSMQQ